MNLIELREVFRKRMQEEDFCIGEDRVEKLFRELLGEPEPPERVYPKVERSINMDSLMDAMKATYADEFKRLYDDHSPLFDIIKKR